MTLSPRQRDSAQTAVPAAPDEPDWVAQAKAGSQHAWLQLVRAHQTAVYRLAYLLLGEPADAEDVAQETFVSAYLALDRFDSTRPLRPWLLQITRNLAHNRRRSVGRYWANLKRFWEREPDTAVSHPAHDARSSARLLEHAVQKLPPKGREIVYLRYFLELSEAETAVILDIPTGTAKSRLSRALGQLRGIIERDFPELREMGD